MATSPYLPIFELSRGETVESVHHGAVAVVDVNGKLIAGYGDPEVVTFLRSSAKPFQSLPFLEHGGQAAYNLTPREIALICASHSGTDEHVAIVEALQLKTGVSETELMCGVHPPYHEPTLEAMRERKEQPTPNRHNCSGKHTAMVAFARLLDYPVAITDDSQPYIGPEHPIQQEIRRTFAELCRLPVERVEMGVDGCSAPNFAVPLRNTALAYARLCDPETGGVIPAERAKACHTITSAMIFNPDTVAGPGRFDTAVMEITQGRILAKAGAEGFEAIGLMPGALGHESPAIGIALKIADGDARLKIRPSVAMEVLRQLGALSPAEMNMLAEYGPTFPVHNWRKIHVGRGRPTFQLERYDTT